MEDRTIDEDNVPLLHALFPEHTRQRLYFDQKLFVCIFLFAPRNRRVPDDGGRVSIPALDMPVCTIVASRYLATGEPSRCGMLNAVGKPPGRFFQCARRLLVPKQLIGLVGPEALGVAE